MAFLLKKQKLGGLLLDGGSILNKQYTFFYKNIWFQFQPAVSYFSLYFHPLVFRILILIFVLEFPEHSCVKT